MVILDDFIWWHIMASGWEHSRWNSCNELPKISSKITKDHQKISNIMKLWSPISYFNLTLWHSWHMVIFGNIWWHLMLFHDKIMSFIICHDISGILMMCHQPIQRGGSLDPTKLSTSFVKFSVISTHPLPIDSHPQKIINVHVLKYRIYPRY